EKRYRYLVQELPNTGVVLYDEDLIVFLVEGGDLLNPHGTSGHFLGNPIDKMLIDLLGQPPEAETLQQVRAVFEDQSHAYEQISGDRCFSVSLVPLRNDEGEIYAGMAVIQDITQRIRVAEKLTDLANQLKMLNHMGQVVVSNQDTDYIFKEVLTTVREMIDAQGAFILLERNGQLLIEAQDEVNHRDLRGLGMQCTEGIGGEVWQSQQGVLLSGEACQAHVFKPLVSHLGYMPLSFLAVPITWQDQRFGVFQALHTTEGKFSHEDLKLVESAASWTAIALGNAFQHQQLERRLAESSVTAELLQEILSASPSLESVLQHVVDAARNTISAVDWAAIHLSDERDNRLHLESISGLSVAAEDYTLEYGQGIAGQVLATGSLINVPDVSEDPRVVSVPRLTGAHSLLVAPIINRDDMGIGTITLQSSTPGQFTAEDERLLLTLARQAGLAIENARLYEAAQYGRRVAQAQRERLRQLTRQMVNAQEEERQRIARELHDEAGQSLTALKISLEILGSSLPQDMLSAREALKEAAEQAGQTLENLRRISHNLRPPALDRLGLNLALEGLCQQFESLTHIQTRYTGSDLPRLMNSYEITLYRFVQEALTNAAKHAEATEVRVWLETQTGQIEIHIQDNGKGMQINPLELEMVDQEGMGLANMEERLKIIDGHLHVQSSLGNGTHLCAHVPLRIKETLE
ncbi:MAG: GAF domain-containing protein, partial [Anaerolineales bacterium]